MALSLNLSSLEETHALGMLLGKNMPEHACIFLQGELGAGKTTLVKSIVKGMGVEDTVLSPSYPIMHSYSTPRGELVHLDLYRLDHGCDFYSMGLSDQMGFVSWLVEWPEKGAYDWLSPDLVCEFVLESGSRRVELIAHSPMGENLLQLL